MTILHTKESDGIGGCFERHYLYGRDRFGREHREYYIDLVDRDEDFKRRSLAGAIERLAKKVLDANRTTEEIFIGEPESYRA